jgi:hypothetical protein
MEGSVFGQGSPLVRSGTHGVNMTHEASHSVIARVVGLPCGGATILPASGSDGMAYFDHRASSLGGILAILAGRIGTQELLGCASDRGNSVDDREVADSLTRLRATAGARQALLDGCRDLCRQHSGTIALVALQLLARGSLSGSEIDALMRR